MFFRVPPHNKRSRPSIFSWVPLVKLVKLVNIVSLVSLLIVTATSIALTVASSSVHLIAAQTHPPSSQTKISPSEGNHNISLETHISKQNLTIGEKFTYTITLTTPVGVELIKPDPLQEFEAFTVLNREVFSAKTGIFDLFSATRTSTFTLRYTLAHYKTGWATLPPIEVIILSVNETTLRPPTKLKTPPTSLYIRPLVTSQDNLNAPIKPPQSIDGKWSRQAGIAVMSLFLLSGGLVLWRKKRYPSHHSPLTKPFYLETQAKLISWQQTLDQFSSLPTKEMQKNPGERETKIIHLYDQISMLTRHYLHSRFKSDDMLTCTPLELKTHLKHLPLAIRDRKIILGFLSKADRVKFSRTPLPLRSAKDFSEHLKTMLAEDARLAEMPHEEVAPIEDAQNHGEKRS